jgi:CHAT domain-containing protein
MDLIQQRSIAVFVSYSHKDAGWLEELRPHLKAVARRHKLRLMIWDDSQIQPGDEWRRKLEQELLSAQGAVLLVSKYFLDSEFILDVELPQLLAAVESRGTRLFTVVLSPCRFEDLPELSKYQTVNPPSRTLEGLPKVEYESVFVELTRKIEQLVLVNDLQPSEVAGGAPADQARISPSPVPTPEPEAVVPATMPGWQRVVVSTEANGDMTFRAIEEGRRVECHVTAAQLTLSAELARRAVADPHFDAEVGRALFQLLIPPSIGELLFKGTGTILVVDEKSARVPWELLSIDGEPLALQASLIRELSTTRFSPVERASDGGALVIGDPQVDAAFPPLPGAAFEARTVAGILETSGQIGVHVLINAPAFNVISAWFGKRWRILHFAGHGVAEYTVGQASDGSTEQSAGGSRKISGLVLDSGLFLTAGEVRQMAAVPDLVFLNAAHMGAISGVRGDAAGSASLAVEFAALGCRAIVAPGWAIDDAAAVTFASAFYEALLNGSPYGCAVLAARQATSNEHPGVNTWAAYQCYGDPSFVLTELRSDMLGVDSKR